MTRHLLTTLVLGAASLAMADAPDPATAARLAIDRDTLRQRLDEIPADRLADDPRANQTLAQLLFIDAQLAGVADDPLLNNEAIRAHRRHRLYLQTLAERAQRIKATLAGVRQKPPGNALKPEVASAVDQKIKAGDAAVLDATSGSADPAGDYLKALRQYDAALADLRAAGAAPPSPPKPVNTLEGIVVADGVLRPTDEQLRTHAGALNGKTVRVRLKIAAMSRPFAEKGTTEFTTADGKVRAVMHWDQSPADVKRAFAQRSTTAAAMKEGDLVWITGTFRGLEAPEQCTVIVHSARK